MGPVAQGRSRRGDHGRADASACGCRRACGPQPIRRAAGPLGGGAALALGAHRHAALFVLSPGRLDDEPGAEAELALPRAADRRDSPRATGAASARERRDARRAAGGRRPLAVLRFARRCPKRLEILGAPARDGWSCPPIGPSALVAVRLNDVPPDGASTRVTYGLLNLTHRDGHERPRRSSRAGAPRATSRSTTSRTRSRPATALRLASRPATGRSPGRRPSR